MQSRSLTVRVARIRALTSEVRAFDLVHAFGGRLPSYRAGAHIDVHTPGGFMRQYSLARAAPDGDAPVESYVIGVKREAAGRGGSTAMHDAVHEGDLLAIGAPRCHFALHDEGTPWLAAGGIGVTPLLAMAQELQRAGRPYRIAVFARSRPALPFADELAALGSVVSLHFDDPEATQKVDLHRWFAAPSPDTRVYLCGPAGFMRAVRAAASGIPDERFHIEHFAAPQGALEAGRGAPFELVLAARGIRVPVGAEQSAAEALADLGIAVPTSCEQGLCGSCVVRWRAGGDDCAEPEHRDHCLTATERRTQVALCCSRAQGSALAIEL